jgi:hypothetical protein
MKPEQMTLQSVKLFLIQKRKEILVPECCVQYEYRGQKWLRRGEQIWEISATFEQWQRVAFPLRSILNLAHQQLLIKTIRRKLKYAVKSLTIEKENDLPVSYPSGKPKIRS